MLNGVRGTIERGPLTAEGINTRLLLPRWGSVPRCKGTRRENTRERELPLYSKAAVQAGVTAEPDEDVRNGD